MSASNHALPDDYLSVLTHAPAEPVKALAEMVIPALGSIRVLQSRTGLVMVPYRDGTQGTLFHLGEALISEAHVRLDGGAEGYAACLGRDLEQAMAIALLDAAIAAHVMTAEVAAFVAAEAAAQAEADEQLLRSVEATRVEMETF